MDDEREDSCPRKVSDLWLISCATPSDAAVWGMRLSCGHFQEARGDMPTGKWPCRPCSFGVPPFSIDFTPGVACITPKVTEPTPFERMESSFNEALALAKEMGEQRDKARARAGRYGIVLWRIADGVVDPVVAARTALILEPMEEKK